jgi:exodeoxyribonuclease V alpha subunit
VEAELSSRGLLTRSSDFYESRPILITENDYQLELFNGDIGVIVTGPSGPRAYFPELAAAPRAAQGTNERATRRFHPARLPAHETVFAMTVHKSQGSEFNDVLLVLPEEASRVTSRELLYTAITRARHGVQICGNEQVLRQTVVHRLERQSGLRDALWGPLDTPAKNS